MDARRGYVPEDDRNFSPDSLETMRKASGNICYLLEEGYELKQAAVFVGNHFLLSERQRLAIMRSVATKSELSDRESRQIPLASLAGTEVWIDGFNTIITLEVMLSGSPVFVCMDGTYRDLAALRGTYRIIDKTKEAVKLMLSVLEDAGIKKATVLLDEPVSNSGRLKALIADAAEEQENTFLLDIRVLKDVDRMLYDRKGVITSDSVILDHCESWINLAEECVKRTKASGIKVW